MNWKSEWKKFALIVGAFALAFYLPVGIGRFDNAIMEALHLVKWYAREHVILCLIPAFFIAGAIGVFISQNSVMKYLGAKAKKIIAYSVASVSGTILAVCSCTVLPLFAGIYRMGAGLGPAIAFLYSGPAINVLAIILTARVLGIEIGIARAVGAIVFSVIIGLLMHLIFRKEENQRVAAQVQMPEEGASRPLWQTALYFVSLVGILIFANFGAPESSTGTWNFIFQNKWIITSVFAVGLGAALVAWFDFKLWQFAVIGIPTAIAGIILPNQPLIPFGIAIIGLSYFTSRSKGETGEWFMSSWGFTKQILPLLLLGVVFAGFFLGRPGHEGIIPSEWVSRALGGNSLRANFFASFAGAFMYFATLTEVPILQGLMGAGMGKGPALSLLLAGPALSLPNMLVIRSIIGTKKTVVFVLLVIIMATISGMIFGAIFG
ncbi:permease [bacterium]|nr:permease [bacterium]